MESATAGRGLRPSVGDDEAELFFLIADFLTRRSACQTAASALVDELVAHRLLGEGVDWRGQRKVATYEDFRLRHRDLRPGHLLELLRHTVGRDQGDDLSSSSTASGSGDVEPAPNAVPTSTSLLLKSRVDEATQVTLPETERLQLAKRIVSQLSALRRNLKTQQVVQQVVNKYERLTQFTSVPDARLLPDELRALVLTTETDKVAALAADVRALKQLFALRKERSALESDIQELTERAATARVFRSTARAGRNQTALLQRRQVNSRREPTLPPAYVYSRIRRLKTLNGHLQIQTYCLTYDKTGKFVITGADDRLIKIWSLETGDLKFTLRGHVGNITDLAVNDSNTLLASSSDDKTVRVWELSTGAPVAVLLGHSSIVNSVRFHPKKNVVVTASDDGRCFCYILPEIPRVTEPETRLETAKRLFGLQAYLLSLHPMYSLSHGLRQGSRSNKVLCLSFSRCGNYVVTGGEDGIARVWDMSILSDPHAPAVVPRYQPTDEPGERVLQPDTTIAIGPDTVATIGQAVDGTINAGLVGLDATLPPPLLVDPVPQQEQPQPQLQLDGVFPGLAALQPYVPTNPANDLQSAAPFILAPRPTVPVAPAAVPGPEPGQDTAQAPPVVPAAAGAVPQQPQLPQLPQGGISSVTVADSDVPRLPNSEPVALLKGHSGPITNIIFSHVGDQVATASIKDGSTRIWKVTKSYQRMKSIVLEPEKPDDDDAFARMYGVHTRRKARPAVDTLMWTKDDQRLITLHSVKPGTHSVDDDWRQRVKVWNPLNGDLVMTLGAIDSAKQHGHINAVFAMDVHPTDWRILVTAGYDGRVFLWDISTGRMLKSFVNLSPESKAVPMLDGGFMPDGNGFCFTDQMGRLLIFGTGSGEQYAAAPVQQYFRRDYAVLVTDRNMNVQDRETHQLPSLMDSGPLVDIYRIEYPHQPPHLLPNVKALTPKEYEENRRQRVEQTKESEIKCCVRHLPEEEEEVTSFPLAICHPARKHTREEAITEAEAVASASFRLNGAPVTLSELRRRPSLMGARRIGRLQRRRSSASLEERDTSILEMEISSDDDHSDEDFQAPARNAANNGDEDEEEEDDEDEDEDDEMDEDDLLSDNEDAVVSPSNFRRRRLRSARSPAAAASRRFPSRGGRRLVEDGEDGEAGASRQLRGRRQPRPDVDTDHPEQGEDEERVDGDDNMEGVERDDDSLSRSSPERMDGGDNVVVESNDGFIMGDNQLDRFDRSLTYAEMLEAKQRQLSSSREATTSTVGEEPLIACAFCSEGDDGGLLKLPGDSMGVHPLVNGSQRLFVHDQCAIASPLCFKRSGNWYNVTKEIRRGRSLACVECRKRGATVGCAIPSCPRSYHWKCAVNCGWSLNQMQFYCPTHESQRSSSTRAAASPSSSESDAEPVARRFGLAFHREWLQLVSLRATHQYVPQVGDYVTYLPEGHAAYLRYCEMRPPSFFARLSSFFAVKCRVLDVKYKFPLVAQYAKCSTIQCEISLAVLAVPTAQAAFASQEDESKQEEAGDALSHGLFDGDQSPFATFVSVDQALRPTESDASSAGATTSTSPRFQIKMVYYSNDVANFLVLDHVYDNGVRGGWQVGDRVKMPYVQLDSFGLETGSKMSYGVIESIAPKETAGTTTGSAVKSPWECITVDWESEEDETCAVCPWELELADPDRQREKRQREIARPSPKLFLSRLIAAEKRDVLLQVVDQITSLSISRDFIYPVDESFLDYLITVPNPIDLTKIRQRLRLGYYRQVEAFIADAKLLCTNCETYNIQSSSIAQNSRSLYNSLLTEAQRHFPHLITDANPASSATSELTYPPDDYVSAFPVESEEERMNHLNVDVSEATYSDPVTDQRVEDTPAPLMSAVASPAWVSDVDIAPVSATPSPAPRRLRNSVQRTGSDSDSGQYQSPTRALRSPLTSTGRQSTRSTALRSGPSTSAALQSPASVQSPTRSGRPRRAARVVTTPVSAEAKPAKKRQRDAVEQEVVTYDGLLEKLTSAQREVFDRACADDVGTVLQDFHEALMQADEFGIFAAPVTEEIAPQYFDIVATPMDFGTMLEQLAQYDTFQDYYDDVHLVFSNAVTYNTWSSQIGEVVAELQKYSVKFLLDAIGATRGPAGRRGGKSRVAAVSKSPAQRVSRSPARARGTALGKRRARSVVSDTDEKEGSWGSDYSESTANDEEEEEEEEEEEDEDSDDSRRPKARAKAKAKRPRR